MKDIFLVHDYETPTGELENGLNFEYFSSHIESEFDKTGNILHTLEQKYHDGVSVWHGEGPLLYAIQGKIATYEVFNRGQDTDRMYLYPINPFGGATCTFGMENSLHSQRSFFFFIPEITKKLIRTRDDFYLFINYSNEGKLDTNFFEIIYKDAEEFGIPFEKIIFCISDYDIQQNFNDWYDSYIERPCNKDKHIPKIKILYHIWSLRDKANEFEKILNNEHTSFINSANKCSVVTTEEVTEKIIRQKKFLMLNRRMRPHRLYSILTFSQLDILDNFFISYDLNTMELFEFNESMYSIHFENEKLSFENLNEEYKKLKCVSPTSSVDFEDLQSVWGFNFEDKRPYRQSYIHIIPETNFFEKGGYFSEKTWKPIGHLQPFIFMGPANGLKEIRKFGFKTFSPFIDERYDDELDGAKRFKMLMEEIHRLSKLPIEEIHNWYHSIFEDVIVHNQKLFLSYANGELMKDFFIKNLFEALNDNS